MDYIPSERGIDFEAYGAYLATIRDRLPPHVAAFAADARHFALDAPETLHDAWLVELSVRESATGMRQERRATEVDVRFLGPFHDREHHRSAFDQRQALEQVALGEAVERGSAERQ